MLYLQYPLENTYALIRIFLKSREPVARTCQIVLMIAVGRGKVTGSQ
jgi:hypothetical protein